jgi:hypothetical protein
MDIIGKATHENWTDNIIFSSKTNSFYREINASINSGQYFFDGIKIVMKWDNWGTVILTLTPGSELKSDELLIKLSFTDVKRLVTDNSGKCLFERQMPAIYR